MWRPGAVGLKRRLMIAYVVLLPIVAASVAFTVFNQSQIRVLVHERITPEHEVQAQCIKLSSELSNLHNRIRNRLDNNEAFSWDSYRVDADSIYLTFDAVLATTPTAEEIRTVRDIKSSFETFENEATRLFIQQSTGTLTPDSYASFNKQAQDLRAGLLRLAEYQNDGARRTAAELTRLARHSSAVLVALILLLFLWGLVLLWSINRHVVKPLTKVKEAALAVANGDLDQRLNFESTDEIGELAAAFDKMSGALSMLTRDLETSVRLATRDLEQSEQKYRQLVQRAQEGIVICDANGCVLEVNRQARKILGLVESKIYGQPLESVVPADRARVGSAIKDAFENGRKVEFLITVQKPEDAPQYLEINGGPVDLPEGRVVQVFLRDVTRQRKIEEQLIRSQRIKSVATLAGGLAHDYNNLLSPILGYASYLRSLPAPDDNFADKLKTIEEAARRAADLSQKLQSLARPRTLVDGARSERVDLNEVIQFAAKLIIPNLNDGVTTTFELAPEQLLVLAEATELQQIVLNLVINANDAMPHGGRLTLGSCREIIANEQWHVLFVRDTGTGMRAEVVERIFDPFFTTKEASKGCGLGLAMVHACVRRAGGRIEVESEEGKGSMFRISFPAASASETLASGEINGLALPAMRILLVDDDAHVRESTRDMLQVLGSEVTSAENGFDALLKLRHQPLPDLAILDMRMTGMSGLELLTSIRSFTTSLPVIFATGNPEERTQEEDFDDPLVSVLRKPFGLAELEAALRRSSAMGSARPRSRLPEASAGAYFKAE